MFALWPTTAGFITGGSVAAVIAIFYALGGALPKWAIWGLISVAFFAAAFHAWREERKQCKQELAAQNRANFREREGYQKELSMLGIKLESAEAQLNDKEKRKEYRIKLSSHLDRLERRISEISAMSALRYIESIDDVPRDGITVEERVANLSDAASVALLKEIADYLESIEAGKQTLFISHTGIEFSGRQDPQVFGGWQTNKQALILDHLKHRAKNLLEIIKSFE